MENTRIMVLNVLYNYFPEKPSSIRKDEPFFKKELIEDLEKGIYNYCIDYSNDNNIIKNWKNPRFKELYLEKTRIIINNINNNIFEIKNNIDNKVYYPHDIPYMKPEELHPDIWKDIREEYEKKYKNAYEDNKEAMTELFKCGKCKQNKCTYSEIQLRSGDEPTSIHIKCLTCGNGWRIC